MRNPLCGALFALLLVCGGFPGAAQQLQPIPLPTPQTTGGKPLMQALAQRQTTRTFSNQMLSPQMLSNLLWRPSA